jgi:hypothetical protein
MKFNLATILKLLQKATNLNETGEPSFNAFEFERVLGILESSAELDKNVPVNERREIIFKACLESAKSRSFSEVQFLAAFKKAEKAYLAAPPEPYIYVTSIGVKGMENRLTRRLGDRLLRIESLSRSRFDIRPISDFINETILYDSYGLPQVSVAVKAKTHAQAFELGRNAFDTLRGIWNLHLNRMPALYIGHPVFVPSSRVLPGPFATLHHPDGQLATREIWYETNTIKDNWLYRADQNFAVVLKSEKSIRSSLARIKYFSELELAFGRYANALDHADPNLAFTSLWAIAEHLSNSEGQYDQMARRLVFLYRSGDPDAKRQLFLHLRAVRNELVHKGVRRGAVNIYLSQLNDFVKSLFRFHLAFGGNFSTLASSAAFLDRSTDLPTLRTDVKLAMLALKIRKGR